jgi:AbrB family looped-hinge helix DNA binding protein
VSEDLSERIHMTRQGRIVVPASMRRALGLVEGQPLTIRLVDDELRISSIRASVKKWQEYARSTNPEQRSLVDELIAERRAEVARELGA